MSIARTALAVTALAAGVLAAFAGNPAPGPAGDEILAVALAEAIRDRQPDLVVLDARADAATAQDRVPGAKLLVSVEINALPADAMVVVYGDATVGADVVDTLRKRAGEHRYRRLHGGIGAWNADVLFPVVRSDAPERQQREFETRAELSRYFDGTPRRLDPGVTAGRPRSRRGC